LVERLRRADYAHIPLERARPDAERFVATVLGAAHPARPPMVEYLVDEALRRPIVTEMMGRNWVDLDIGDAEAEEAYLDNFIAFWREMGYDCVRYEESLPFVEREMVGDDATQVSGQRHWRDLHQGAIRTWEDLERYPWPEISASTFRRYAYLNDHLPEGMGLLVCHGGGIYEHLSALLSYEGLCYALYDQPELVRAVADRLGALMLRFYEHLVELDRVVAIFPGDDMGFRTATLLPPEALQTYTLPWHRRYAALAHVHGLPYLLHSCGNLAEIMDVLIDEVGIDGKHSFEDAIMPVWEMQARYGERIAMLGGVDVDVLTRRTPEGVRERVRETIARCHPQGRFCIGSGNSIPSYVPLTNYVAMIDEAQRPV
jgi:uroporphyrinogen decarboxylase